MRAGAATRGKILVVLPTLGDRIDSLEETLESVAQQRAEVDLTLVVILPERAARGSRPGGEVRRGRPARPAPRHLRGHQRRRARCDRRGVLRLDRRRRPLPRRRPPHPARPARRRSLGRRRLRRLRLRRRAGTHDRRRSRAGRAARWLLPWGPDLIPHPGSIIRLDALRAIGLFDPSLKYAMDLDAFLSLRAHGRVPLDPHERVGVPLASGLADGGQPRGIEPRGPGGQGAAPAGLAAPRQPRLEHPRRVGSGVRRRRGVATRATTRHGDDKGEVMSIDKSATTYVAGHRGLVGSAIWRRLEADGYTNLVGRTSAEVDLRDREATFDLLARGAPPLSDPRRGARRRDPRERPATRRSSSPTTCACSSMSWTLRRRWTSSGSCSWGRPASTPSSRRSRSRRNTS